MRRLRLSVCSCLVFGLLLLGLVGCSSTPVTNSSANGSASTALVSLSMTDDPPSGVTVLFFQISLTAAYLTPTSGSGNVSLLNNNTPIQVDVTQLQAITDFLSTAQVAAGTYKSLTLTFANPRLVIFNQSDQTIASTCPVQTVCQVTPQIDGSATLTFSTAPFPLTLTPGNPLGFLLDFHLNEVIQQDLSVNWESQTGSQSKNCRLRRTSDLRRSATCWAQSRASTPARTNLRCRRYGVGRSL